MKRQSRLGCGGKELITDNLSDASEFLMKNIEGLRSFEVRLVVHSEDWGCSLQKHIQNPPELPMKMVPLGKWEGAEDETE